MKSWSCVLISWVRSRGITSRGDDAVRQLGEACRLLAELGGEQSAESPPSVGSDNYRIGIVLAYRVGKAHCGRRTGLSVLRLGLLRSVTIG